jgi:hypothetical protein
MALNKSKENHAPAIVENKSDRKLTKNEKRRLREKEKKKLGQSEADNSNKLNQIDELNGIEIEYVSADYSSKNLGSMLDQFKEIFEKVNL